MARPRVLEDSPAVLTAEEAGLIAGGASKPYNARRVREMVRDGAFPAPIDDQLHPRSWRWARSQVEQYARGEWVRPPATDAPADPVRLPASPRRDEERPGGEEVAA